MKEFRNDLEKLLPNVIYQEQWCDDTCFNLHFITKLIGIMVSQDMDITDDDLDCYARMPIDIMIEKRPYLLQNILTAIKKYKAGTSETNNPEDAKKKVEQWMKKIQGV